MYDYVITKPPLNEETLMHYGVMGMKWGIRKDIRKTGSISDKTKKKILKNVKNASYKKTRKRLNQLEKIKSDYRMKGESLSYHSKNKDKLRNNDRALRDLDKLSKTYLKSAQKKGYKYDKRSKVNISPKYSALVGGAHAMGGIIGNIATSAGLGAYHHNYVKSGNSRYGSSSPLIDEKRIVYKKKKKR